MKPIIETGWENMVAEGGVESVASQGHTCNTVTSYCGAPPPNPRPTPLESIGCRPGGGPTECTCNIAF